MFKKPTSANALASKLKAHAEFGPRGEWHRNNCLAANALDGDLGRHAETPFDYGYDDDTRDRLIAHARQDAAWAALNSASVMKQAKSLRRLVWFQFIVLAVMLLAMHAPL